MGSLPSRARLVILLVLLLFAAPSTVGAQPSPANGYVGVYFDRAGTEPCGNVPPFGPSTLYVLATLQGATQDGITGAGFRLEISNSSGYFMTYTLAPGSCDFCIGNVLDSTPCVGDAAGIGLAYPQCQASDPIAGPGRVFLGTISVINIAGGPFTIETKRGNPSHPQFLCPSFSLCDVPQFTQVCMTFQEGDPALGGREPVAFRTVVGDVNCSAPPSCIIDVEATAWSAVKGLYRD